MPFGLINALVTFYSIIDHMIYLLLDKFAVYYLDDILIFSNILKEYKEYIKAVLNALYKYKLLVNKDKASSIFRR